MPARHHPRVRQLPGSTLGADAENDCLAADVRLIVPPGIPSSHFICYRAARGAPRLSNSVFECPPIRSKKLFFPAYSDAFPLSVFPREQISDDPTGGASRPIFEAEITPVADARDSQHSSCQSGLHPTVIQILIQNPTIVDRVPSPDRTMTYNFSDIILVPGVSQVFKDGNQQMVEAELQEKTQNIRDM